MDDMMGKINEILSDEESMAQIKQLAEMLGVGMNGDAAPPPENSSGDGGFDFAKIMQLQGLAQSATQNDKNANLLLALQPHLSEERQVKVTRAVKILKLLSVISAAKQAGILDNLDSLL